MIKNPGNLFQTLVILPSLHHNKKSQITQQSFIPHNSNGKRSAIFACGATMEDVRAKFGPHAWVYDDEQCEYGPSEYKLEVRVYTLNQEKALTMNGIAITILSHCSCC